MNKIKKDEDPNSKVISHLKTKSTQHPRSYWLALSYLATKFLYLLVVFVQFFVLNNWFNDEYHKRRSLVGKYRFTNFDMNVL